MKHIKSILIILNLVAVLFYFHYSVNQKEKTLNDSQLILLELAPVDPRSLMQGDYMDLRYSLTRAIRRSDFEAEQGFCVIGLDSNHVAQLIRVQKENDNIDTDEYILKFQNNGKRTSIGAESYFFEEGQAEKFEKAKYGGLKVDKGGNSVLIGLYNKAFELL